MNFVRLVALSFLIYYCETSKLNRPRVLLPYFKNLSTNFTLEVTGVGCYKWSSSRLDLVRVVPIEEKGGCSLKAIVSSVAAEPTRHVAIVLAEEVDTGEMFQADIIVDSIATLEIVTTTRELYMEEPPEIFEVRAHDVKGNEFTTVEGIEFEWEMTGIKTESAVLRFMSFRDSTYKTPPSIVHFDSVGKQGHIVLIEGVRKGTSKVSVRLPQQEYKDISPVEVCLSVIDHLIIQPSNVFILADDEITFKVFKVRQGRMKLLDLEAPNSQYLLFSEDRSVVKIEGSEGLGVELGSTVVAVRDQTAPEGQESRRLPTAVVTVVEPAHLALAIHPFNNWALVTQQPATIVTQVFDKSNNMVMLGTRSRIDMKLEDESVFLVESRTENGSALSGHAAAPGATHVLSKLLPFPSHNHRRILEASAVVHVFTPLILNPPLVVFPYHLTHKGEVQMKVEGGDGLYRWETEDGGVAVVSNSGLLKQQGERGETRVTVSLLTNQHIRASSDVYVLKPSHIVILGGTREVEVGAPLFLDIALYGLTKKGQKVPFSDCTQLHFVVTADSPFHYDPLLTRESGKGGCAVIGLTARNEGKSRVVVGLATETAMLEADTSVASFKPLEPLHPVTNKPIILAVGSSRHLVVTGGPKTWFGKISSSVSNPNPSITTTKLFMQRQELYVYNVLCTKIGSTKLVVGVKTEPTVPNVEAVSSSTSVPVICGNPKFLDIYVNMGPECPISGNEKALTTFNSKLIVNLVIKDSEGRIFDNATSLEFRWTMSKNLLMINEPEIVNLNKTDRKDYILPLNHYKDIATSVSTGSCIVQVSIVGYRARVLAAHQITVPKIDGKIESTLNVQMVEPVSSFPSTVSVINHASSQAVVDLVHGSDYFSVSLVPDHIASVEIDSARRKLLITPLAEGFASLQINDLCLPTKTFITDIQVVNMGGISVEVSPRLEKGQKIVGRIKLFDVAHQQLSATDKLEIELESSHPGIVSIKRHLEDPLVFTVLSQEVGHTSLVAIWNNVTSLAAPIQVFSGIKLIPRNVTMLVGSELQIEVQGGPGPGLVFSVSDTTIASVSNTGLISASHIGDTIVTASAVGVDIVSRDSVAVTVVPLGGVRIVCPVTVLLIGSAAPAWVEPLPSSVSAIILASVQPSYSFVWSSSQPRVATIVDRFSNLNIQVKDEDRFSVEVRGLKPGRTTVRLTVSSPSQTWYASLEMEIIEEFHFLPPSGPSSQLLVAPRVSFPLSTNYQHRKNGVDYKVLSSTEGEFCDKKDVVSLNEGLLQSHCVGHAWLLATANHPPLTELSTQLYLQVKPVHYLMMKTDNDLKPRTGLHSLPRGLMLHLNVSYHDDMGKQFFAVPSAPAVKTHRRDRVHVSQGASNASLIVSLDLTGVTVLHVYDPISHCSLDYLKLTVNNHIVPARNHMTVGDIVCFSSSVGQGSWSSDKDTVAIEEHGMAKAFKVGTATLTFTMDTPKSQLVMSTLIEVLPFYGLLFGRLSESTAMMTNAEVGAEFKIPVYLTSDRLRREAPTPCLQSSYSPQVFPFTCEMRFNSLSVAQPVASVFSLQPSFDRSLGSYVCLVKVVEGASANVSMIESNVTVRAVHESGLHSDSLVLAFHPAFYLVTLFLDLSSYPQNPAYVTVVATPHVASQLIVVSSDSTLMTVGPMEIKSGVSYSWPVRLVEPDFWRQSDKHSDLAIHIISHLTHQRVNVGISTGSIGKHHLSCVPAPQSDWSFSDTMQKLQTSVFIVVVTIVVILVISSFCSVQMNRAPPATPSPIREIPHSILQEAALGRKSTPSPLVSSRTVYGSTPHNTSTSPRFRRLYQ